MYRYVLKEKLGAGGMGEVYRAVDRLTGQTVALKRVLTEPSRLRFNSYSSNDDQRFALTREFQMLATLRHPHIISVLDYGFDTQPYFTMPLLEKPQTLIEAAQHQTDMGKINLLIQMLQALAYLHRRGVTHRDLKPGNVLIDQSGQVNVVDFGVALVDGQTSGIAGTLAYMAPEVLKGEGASPVADLYAVGLMMYEMFTGEYPFSLRTATHLIHQIMFETLDMSHLKPLSLVLEDATTKPVNLKALNREVPFGNPLALVIDKLTQKDPQARYQDAAEVIQELCGVLGLPVPAESRAIRESFLQAAAFVGRDDELRQLTIALDDAFVGEGSAWLIGGESGVGKSRLVNELRIRALVQGATVLHGQAVAEGGLPYHLWREVLARLCLLTALNDREAAILKEIVPSIERLLERAIAEAPTVEGAAAHFRLMTTIVEVLRQQTMPTLLILEDLHWSQESLEVLKQVCTLIPEQRLMIVGTYRDDERPHLPKELPLMQVMKVTRLGTASIAKLSESMLGENGRNQAVVALLERETEGNVFFLVEVVRVLAEEAGRLSEVGLRTLPAQVFAGGVQQIVQRRLNHVPDRARPTLKLAAVAGRLIDLTLIGEWETKIDVWLTACANAAVLEVQDNQWRFAHDKLREGLLAGLGEEEARSLHRQVAETIEKVHLNVAEQAAVLAYHWQVAGNADKERYYARLAGDQAMRTSDYRQALEFYERAMVEHPQEQAVLRFKIGDIFRRRGDYPQAKAHLEASIRLAREIGDERILAQALVYLGIALSFMGDKADASPHYAEALDVAQRVNDPLILVEVLSWAAAERLIGWNDIEGARSLLDIGLTLSRAIPSPLHTVRQLYVLGGLVAQVEQDEAAGLPILNEALEVARELGDRYELSNVLGTMGGLLIGLERWEEAEAIYAEALPLVRSIDHLEGLSLTLTEVAEVAMARGNFEQAGDYLHEALGLVHAQGAEPMVLRILMCVANYEVKRGAVEQGLALVGLVQGHPLTWEDAKRAAVEYLEEWELDMTKEAIEAGLERGREMVLGEVVEKILAR